MPSIHLLCSFSQLWWLVTIHSIITFSRLFLSLLLMCPKHIHLHLFISDSQVFFPIIYLIYAFIIFSVQKIHNSSLAPDCRSFNFLCHNNFSKVTFISCYSKKIRHFTSQIFVFPCWLFSLGFLKGSHGWINYSSKYSSFYWTGSDWVNLMPGKLSLWTVSIARPLIMKLVNTLFLLIK